MGWQTRETSLETNKLSQLRIDEAGAVYEVQFPSPDSPDQKWDPFHPDPPPAKILAVAGFKDDPVWSREDQIVHAFGKEEPGTRVSRLRPERLKEIGKLPLTHTTENGLLVADLDGDLPIAWLPVKIILQSINSAD